LDVGLTFKKKDQVFQRAKIYHKEGQYLIKIWQNEHVHVVPHPKVWKSLVKHVHEELGHFGVCWKYIVYFKVDVGGKACNWKFKNYDAWCVVEFVHHLLHPLHIYNLYHSWGLGINGI